MADWFVIVDASVSVLADADNTTATAAGLFVLL